MAEVDTAAAVALAVPGDPAKGKSTSRTVTDTITGEHEHTIVGYSLVKGIGDGEPIASERFNVGGHEWVLLFYPDGKRSSSSDAAIDGADGGAVARIQPPLPGAQQPGRQALPPGYGGQQPPQRQGGDVAAPNGNAPALPPPPAQQLPVMRPGMPPPVPLAPPGHPAVPRPVPQQQHAQPPAAQQQQQHQHQGHPQHGGGGGNQQQHPQAQAQQPQQQGNPQQGHPQPNIPALGPPPGPDGGNNHAIVPAGQHQQQQQMVVHQQQQHAAAHQAAHQAALMAGGAAGQPRREASNDYAALFVALIGEGDQPMGVVSTSDGRVVRAFHRFTLVDQSAQGGRDLTKGRRRDQGAVKISCARQDPNARNCHGYRKFVKRSVLENPANGYLLNDTIIIRYTIELVVSSGGALTKTGMSPQRLPSVQVPPSNMGQDMQALLESAAGSDVTFKVEGELMKVHRIILQARSPVFKALLGGSMREGKEDVVEIQDVLAPVFKALLHFSYTDSLPEELDNANLDVAMAQHLLVAADRFQLLRLRRICERRLCETVEVETVATTLALGEQNHAAELKRVCLEFVSRNLQAVMNTDGYQHMIRSCPQLQAELLHTIAAANAERSARPRFSSHPRGGHEGQNAPEPVAADDQQRRVRQRRE